MQTVVETPTYLRHAKQIGMADGERAAIIDMIAADPIAGDLIEGTGGARKVRFAKRGAGKSGGYRIITYHAADDVPTFLLDVYGKGQKVSLTKAEKNALAELLVRAADRYRQSAREKAEAEQTR